MQKQMFSLKAPMTASRLWAKACGSAMAVVLLCSATPISAQELRGSVMRDPATPASGALVLLVHPTNDSILARTVTSERGLFSLTVPGPMSVRLRVLRMGFQPTDGGVFALKAGDVQTTRVALQDRRIALAAFNVQSENRCQVRPESGRLVAQLFEEARKALLGSAAAVSGVKSTSQFTLFKRTEDLQKRLSRSIERSTFSGPSWMPFAAVSADSLARFGYVLEEPDGTVYRAPDAGVLTSDSFLASHCLQYVEGKDARSANIGIAFKPVNRKKGLVDVTGTLWLDRETSELQQLEYSYEGLTALQEQARPGGQVDYTQMDNGVWFVNKWVIRMPVIASTANASVPGERSHQLAGTYALGGEVQTVTMDGDVLYANPAATLAGSEPRDASQVRATVGKFEVEAAAQVVSSKPAAGGAIDSLTSTSVCVGVVERDYSGIASGRVTDSDAKAFAGATVSAEWKEDFRASGKNDFSWQVRRLETTVSDDGRYTLCGLPERRPITLTAVNAGRKSRVATVRFADKSVRATMNLSIGSTAVSAAGIGSRNAALFVNDLDGNPIPHATVILNGGTARVTDDDGRLIVYAAPRDSLTVLTRRIGYQAFSGKVVRDSAGAFQVVLRPNAQSLATMNVRANASSSPLVMAGFYERMRDSQRGALVGEFYTPEMIEARSAGSLSQFLAVSRWVSVTKADDKVVRGHLVVLTSPRLQCRMNLVLDGISVGADSTSDVNEFVSFSQVSAIEVYPTAANVPASIGSRVPGLACGVIAVWTGGRERSKPK